MASSSNSGFKCIYDVFLSFRGLDTRKKFTGHLNEALKQEGFKTFIDDDDIERGEKIKSELQKAICSSRMSIIVLSKNYTDSTACLFEIQTIIEHSSKKESDHWILPVFYEVDPGEIKEQMKELAKHLVCGGKKVTVEEVEGWSAAVKKVVSMAGMVSGNQSNGYEAKFIKDIIGVLGSKQARGYPDLDKKLRTLKRKVDYLIIQENHIDSEITHAERPPWKRRKKEVEVWLTDVQSLKEYVQRLQLEVVGEMDGFSRRLLGNDIVKKTQEASELQGKGERFFDGLLIDENPTARVPVSTPKDFVESTKDLDEKLRTLKRKVDYLISQEIDINSEITNAERPPWKRLKKEVEVWLTDVQSLKEYVQRLQLEVVGEMNGFSRLLLGKDIVKKTQEASELQEKGKGFGGLLIDENPTGRLPVSNSESQPIYDIFLSFRGPDTHKKFTNLLYETLKEKGYNPFRDREGIETGENIKSELRKGIENSKISIIVFSKNYTTSTALLFEIQTIIEHREKNPDYIIVPVYYEVDPFKIKTQAQDLDKMTGVEVEVEGKKVMVADFEGKKVRVEMLKEWSAALMEVAGLGGVVSGDLSRRYAADLIAEIIAVLGAKQAGNYQLFLYMPFCNPKNRLSKLRLIMDTMKGYFGTFRLAYGQEWGEKLPLQVDYFQEDRKIHYIEKIPATGCTPNLEFLKDEPVALQLGLPYQPSATGCIPSLEHLKDGRVMQVESWDQWIPPVSFPSQRCPSSVDSVNNGMYDCTESQNSYTISDPGRDSLSNGTEMMQVDSSDQASVDPSNSFEDQEQSMELNFDDRVSAIGTFRNPGIQDANTVTVRAKVENYYYTIKFSLSSTPRLVELQQEVAKRKIDPGAYDIFCTDEGEKPIGCDYDLQQWIDKSRSLGNTSITVMLRLKQPTPT